MIVMLRGKIILLCLLVLLTRIIVIAQTDRIALGVNASFDLFTCDKALSISKPDVDPGMGGSAQLLVSFNHNNRLFAETALGASYAWSPVLMIKDSQGEECHQIYDISRLAIQLPIHIGYKFHFAENHGIGVFTGVQTSYSVAGSLHCDEKAIERFNNYRLYGENAIWKRFGVSAVIGLRFLFNDSMDVTLIGNMGLTNMSRAPIFKYHIMNESDVKIGFTYWFKSWDLSKSGIN